MMMAVFMGTSMSAVDGCNRQIVAFSRLSCNPSSSGGGRHAIFEGGCLIAWWKDVLVLCRLRPYLLLAFLGLLFFTDLFLHPAQILYADHSELLAMLLPMTPVLVHSFPR